MYNLIFPIVISLIWLYFLLSFLYQAAVFPPENQVSPVADQLRKVLSTAPWARVGLGLPVVSV